MTEMWAPGVCFVYLRACQPVLAVHFPAQANFVMQRNVKGHPQDRSLLFHNLKDAPLTHFLCVYLPPENSAVFRASYYQTRSPVPDSAAPWLYSYLKLVSFDNNSFWAAQKTTTPHVTFSQLKEIQLEKKKNV